MSYIDDHLLTGERVVHRTALHWYVFVPSALALGFALILFLADLPTGGGVLLFTAFALGLWALAKKASSEFAVTDRRVIVKEGIVTTRSIELNLEKVEGILVKQDLGGKILGYGTIIVSGTGGTKEPFDGIVGPYEFRRAAQEGISASQAAPLAAKATGNKYCINCGQPVAGTGKFCGSCGAPAR